jgi:ABC-type nitrate/sulfonate/bicarbonate transport system ATPase subunit
MAGKGVLAELPDPTQAWRQLNLDALCRWQMLGVLFVDQSVERALACSDRIYAMDNGRMALTAARPRCCRRSWSASSSGQ